MPNPDDFFPVDQEHDKISDLFNSFVVIAEDWEIFVSLQNRKNLSVVPCTTTLLSIYERILYICTVSIFLLTIENLFIRIQESKTCSLSMNICVLIFQKSTLMFASKT